MTVLSMPRQVSPPGLTLNSAEKPVRTRRSISARASCPVTVSGNVRLTPVTRYRYQYQGKPAALYVARQWTPALVLQVYPDFIADRRECARFERLGKAPDCGRYAIRNSDAGYDRRCRRPRLETRKSAARSP